MQNFITLGQRRKVTRLDRKKERKHAVKSGHYLLSATPKSSARNSLRPKDLSRHVSDNSRTSYICDLMCCSFEFVHNDYITTDC